MIAESQMKGLCSSISIWYGSCLSLWWVSSGLDWNLKPRVPVFLQVLVGDREGLDLSLLMSEGNKAAKWHNSSSFEFILSSDRLRGLGLESLFKLSLLKFTGLFCALLLSVWSEVCFRLVDGLRLLGMFNVCEEQFLRWVNPNIFLLMRGELSCL